MRFDKPFTETQISLQLKELQTAFQRILAGNASQVSYQLTYDQIYRLCRQNHQQRILQILYNLLTDSLPLRLQSCLKESQDFLQGFYQCIKDIEEIFGRLSEICLYLDLNYCQRENNFTLKLKFNETFFMLLCKPDNKGYLKQLGEKICQKHIEGKDIKGLLKLLVGLDLNEELLAVCIVPYYLPELIDSYQGEAEKKYKELAIEEYLVWVKDTLEGQLRFLRESFQREKGKKQVSHIIEELYKTIVSQYREDIYKNNQKQLFERLNLHLLQIYQYCKTTDIDQHLQWFMSILQKHLNSLNSTDNAQFIESFYQISNQITTRLQSTVNKFDINYRAVFTFQEWINLDRNNINKRLNVYIDQKYRSLFKEPKEDIENFRKYCLLLFRLMKEKNSFEREYRILLIERIIDRCYDQKNQEYLVTAMGKECGQEWVADIDSIMTSMKQAETYDHKSQFNPIILNGAVWPRENKMNNASNMPELEQIASKFKQSYLEKNQGQSLVFHPVIGKVLLSVKFNKDKSYQFICNTCMANLALYAQKKGKFEIKNFCAEIGLELDNVYESLERMVEARLFVTDSPTIDLDSKFQLNDNYELNETVAKKDAPIDLKKSEERNKFQTKVMEELKADRKMMVEAILVKILKAEKMVSQEELLKKTEPMLAKRGFNFNKEFVLKSIERLVDKEFFRDFEDGNLGYLA